VRFLASVRSLFASRKRGATLASVALIIVLVVGTYAYLKSLPPTAGPRVYIRSSVAEFYLELDKSDYEFGENMTITFYVENTSNKTIEIFKPSISGVAPPHDKYFFTETFGVSGSGLNPYYFHFGYLLEYINGTELVRKWNGELQTPYDLYVMPGGYIKQTIIHGPLMATLYPGTYRIRAHFGYIKQESVSIDLETPEIIFAVR
jgi:hypothetical protein